MHCLLGLRIGSCTTLTSHVSHCPTPHLHAVLRRWQFLVVALQWGGALDAWIFADFGWHKRSWDTHEDPLEAAPQNLPGDMSF